MTSNAPSRLFVGNPNAATIPSKIGTTAPARAVALGTKNAKTIDTTMEPKIIAPVLTPTFDRMKSANRLCRLVVCMAVARNNAAATNATAGLENPANAILKAFFVPSSSSGFSIFGASPRSTAANPRIIAALTGYGTASVTHKITANARMARALCPTTGRSAGLGSKTIVMSATKARSIHSPFKLRFCFSG